MNKKFISSLIAGLSTITFFVVGILNMEYIHKLKAEVEPHLALYFSSRGEKLLSIYQPDHSLGQIEVGAITETKKYYVVLSDDTPVLVRFSALNFVWKPSLKVHFIEESDFGT
jgi:hypothetical protein